MPRMTRRNVRILCGVSLLFLGVAGLGLPVLQGWLFILMGIWLLAEDFPFFARLSARIKRGFSAFARA